MQSKIVAILETRTGELLAQLIERRGATALLAPALEELPDADPQAVEQLLRDWQAHPFQMAIFQTGVGTRALFQTTDSLGATARLVELLTQARVVVRGPKPVGELAARGVRIDVRASSPFTTEAVLESVSGIDLAGSRVLVQRYGQTNKPLAEALTARGATVQEIATYRWGLPADTGPLLRLLDALAAARVDAVVFTSAVQVENLYAVAERVQRARELAGQLNGVIVASIGPVCSRALRQRGVRPTFEADPPKLGPLVAALEQALAAGGQRLQP
jgi:uroporphyrinogen-III synthase